MIRIGCLGAARITPKALIEPARAQSGVTIQAVAARDPARARAFADTHAIPHVADSYAALIARDDVDLVYNALPPKLHAPWSIAALQAGKHVLCEKPFCLNAGEAVAMADAARASGKLLIEGYHYRHHALMARILEIVKSGALGAIVAVNGAFKVPIRRTPEELRWRADLGGGAMMDLGCYPLHAMRTILGVEPDIVSARARFVDGVDSAMEASLRFGAVPAKLSTAMRLGFPYAILDVRGEKATLRARNFVAPQLGNVLTYGAGAARRIESVGGPSTFAAQLAHVVAVLQDGAQPIPSLDDSIAQMRAIDAIYAAARA